MIHTYLAEVQYWPFALACSFCTVPILLIVLCCHAHALYV